MNLTRLRRLNAHLSMLIKIFEELGELSSDALAIEPYHIFIDSLPYSYKKFESDIAHRRVLNQLKYSVSDLYFTKDDRRRFAKEIPYVRIDLMRTVEENEPLMVFNAFFFLGDFDGSNNQKITCFQRNYEVFADSFEGNGTLGKLFRLMTEIDLLVVYEEKLKSLQQKVSGFTVLL